MFSLLPSKSSPRLFTFVELLVVIAILSALLSILLPNLFQARKKTGISVCANNQRMISLALHSYTSDNRRFLPQHRGWGTLLGKEVTFRGRTITLEERPLNIYLNYETEYGICPADKGDSFSPDEPYAWNKVHENWGNSYLPQWGVDNFATLMVTDSEKPPSVSSFEIPDKKLFLADWVWHMNRNLDDPRSQWHESISRRCNTLFLDGRVTYFTFPTFLPRNTPADVDRYGWY